MIKNANFWPHLAVFGTKIVLLMGRSKTIGTLISGNLLDTCFVLEKIDRQWSARDEKMQFWPQKFWYLGSKGNFLFRITIFRQKGMSQIQLWLPQKYIPSPKKFPFPRLGVIFHFPGLIPEFCQCPIINTFNFGPSSTSALRARAG